MQRMRRLCIVHARSPETTVQRVRWGIHLPPRKREERLRAMRRGVAMHPRQTEMLLQSMRQAQDGVQRVRRRLLVSAWQVEKHVCRMRLACVRARQIETPMRRMQQLYLLDRRVPFVRASICRSAFPLVPHEVAARERPKSSDQSERIETLQILGGRKHPVRVSAARSLQELRLGIGNAMRVSRLPCGQALGLHRAGVQRI